MSLVQMNKQEVLAQVQRSANDTGSPEAQVSILTMRIRHLTEHFKTHKKDLHSRYGLLKMVSLRRKLLKYLKNKNNARYQSLIKQLELRDSN